MGRALNWWRLWGSRVRLLVRSEQLRAQGCVAAGEARPAVAYGGQRVQFWISPLKFMIELVEAPEHRHAFRGEN
jgi:hypothetical protein